MGVLAGGSFVSMAVSSGQSGLQNSQGALWAWRVLSEQGLANLGPCCGAEGGGAQLQFRAPPQGLRQLSSPGGQAGRDETGSGLLRSFLEVQRSPAEMPTLVLA